MFEFAIFKSYLCYRNAKEVCDTIVAKCLTGRPKTVEKAQASFMLWVELEAVDAFLVRYAFCLFESYTGACYKRLQLHCGLM